MIPEPTIYEYCLLRYVPDIERGEFVNVGLLMMCKRRRWLRAATHVDTAHLSALRGVDEDLLRRQLTVFERTDVPAYDLPVEERYRWLAAVKSAIIQTSPSHPGILAPGETLDTTFDRLLRTLVL